MAERRASHFWIWQSLKCGVVNVTIEDVTCTQNPSTSLPPKYEEFNVNIIEELIRSRIRRREQMATEAKGDEIEEATNASSFQAMIKTLDQT